MNKDRFLQILDNPDFIFGIHNYCDRWCERCTMTSRCSSFAIEKERFPDKEREKIKQTAKESSCVINANQYAKSVDTWFDDAKELLEQKEQELNKQLELNLPSSD